MIVAYEWQGKFWCPDCCPQGETPVFDSDECEHHVWCALCRRELDLYVPWCGSCEAGLCYESPDFLPPIIFVPNSPEAWAAYFRQQKLMTTWIAKEDCA
ncbi:hypothetical protein [Ktedonospora formicarum]|uniref:Uncharacterized protein n=1 Tax=Ktedonospora formicarum TaxID=2778364 RepID=A0A8J3HXS3_9CHLR|nr:hypothetical protein [Ktedonospora formicarum]GHO45171.1 hypothetical protein KSX_33340 [Ktedonospora formicarum]